jgi:hypothetical protein
MLPGCGPCGLPPAQRIPHGQDRKAGEGKLTAQPAGFPQEAIQPFQIVPAPAGRSPRKTSGENVEGAADAHADRRAQARRMVPYPQLLTRKAKAHEDKSGSGQADVPSDLILLPRREVPVVCARDDKTRVSCAQRLGGAGRNALTSAKEVDRPAPLGTQARQNLNQLHAGDAHALPVTGKSRGIDDADAVRHDQLGRINDLAITGIPAGEHRHLAAKGDDVSKVPRFDKCRDPFDGTRHVNDVHAAAQHVRLPGFVRPQRRLPRPVARAKPPAAGLAPAPPSAGTGEADTDLWQSQTSASRP